MVLFKSSINLLFAFPTKSLSALNNKYKLIVVINLKFQAGRVFVGDYLSFIFSCNTIIYLSLYLLLFLLFHNNIKLLFPIEKMISWLL